MSQFSPAPAGGGVEETEEVFSHILAKLELIQEE